jgi:hypothetical protein
MSRCLLPVWQLVLSYSGALSDERSGLSFVIVYSLCQYVHILFTFVMFDMCYIYNIHKAFVSPGSVRQIMALQIVAKATTALLDTWTVVHVTAAKFKPLILSLVQCYEHFHYHDSKSHLPAACIISLCSPTRIWTKEGYSDGRVEKAA